MAIRILENQIKIGDFILEEYEDGLKFSGVASTLTTSSGPLRSNYGYMSGGSPPAVGVNTIIKFPFAIDTNATDVGDLTGGRYNAAGQSSTVSGYTSGGQSLSTELNTIDKFPFATDTNATDVGDLTVIRDAPAGQSSTVSGYTSGGGIGGYYIPTPTSHNIIDKFPFATDANATDVGNLTVARPGVTGQSSSDNGYTSGGWSFPPFTLLNIIDKFPFATDTNATDVGDMTQARYKIAGQFSDISGYISGGSYDGGGYYFTYVNTIEKFPFATDSSASDVGDLTQSRNSSTGQSSNVSGYNSAGLFAPSPTTFNTIDKFPFATDANATDVGDVSIFINAAGQQY